VSYLVLEDGRVFPGRTVVPAERGLALGEVVFTTGMTGYQEAVTDPSYFGQILVFTAPMVGNYGAGVAFDESRRAHTPAVVMREARNGTDARGADRGWLDWLAMKGVPAIDGVDTRALVRHLRERGAMRGAVVAPPPGQAAVPVHEALAAVLGHPSMTGADLVGAVTTSEPYVVDGAGSDRHVVAIDCGIKRSIVDQLVGIGAAVTVVPAGATADEILALEPDGVFCSNGPGDPEPVEQVTATLRRLIAPEAGVPVFGICLGHQLLARAAGLPTFKLPFGHHGANHPVVATDGTVEISTQNHGFAVREPNGSDRVQVTHRNGNDRTVEGLALLDAPAFSVQYHPEASPGPHDARHHFTRFRALMDAGRGG
jgi:carbamoyl-phosphate synthase small subunit